MKCIEVWKVTHTHVHTDGYRELKLIGIFYSDEKATNAVSAASEEEGFRDGVDGFQIDRVEVDQAVDPACVRLKLSGKRS